MNSGHNHLMASLIDWQQIDLEACVADREAIQAINPHRHEFSLLDRIIHVDRDQDLAVGASFQSPDAYWVKGHIPGRPLMPGVLMVETMAQLSSWLYQHEEALPEDKFLGFMGIKSCKFRGQVLPEQTFYCVGKITDRRRIQTIECEGFCEGKKVVEAVIQSTVF